MAKWAAAWSDSEKLSLVVVKEKTMRKMMNYVGLMAFVLLLSACSSVKPQQVEMPNLDDSSGSDVVRSSPCACVEYSDFINGLGQVKSGRKIS
ncbi:MAG: hypothetical protein HRT36_06925 [Alphaproteobacteria bacterium]|nr:hypothetical protein [Alphaproteobacteria bacterium]